MKGLFTWRTGREHVAWNRYENRIHASSIAADYCRITNERILSARNRQRLVFLSVPSTGRLHIALFNSLGQKVRVLLDVLALAAEYRLVVDGSAHSPGVFFCLISFENVVRVMETLLVK